MAVINGSSGANTLIGTGAADEINGLAGDDLINARTRPTAAGSGIDVVDGGAGFDILVIEAGSETGALSLFTGGSPTYQLSSASGNFAVNASAMEAVRFFGGAGNDSIDTGDRGGSVNGNGGVDFWHADLGGLFTSVTFVLGVTTSIAAAGLASILNIEQIDLTTGSGNDTVVGGAQADRIVTGEGDDRINARTRPTMPGSGIDVVDGGADTDTLVVDASAETQTIQLFAGGSPSFQLRSESGRFFLDAFDIERIEFKGGAGADRIETADREGKVDGGGGIDTWIADLSALTAGVTYVVGTTAAIAAAGLTEVVGIERLQLTTGSGDDLVTGGGQDDLILTGAGNDTINARTRPTAGGSGIDVVDGGVGTDTLVVDATGEGGDIQLFAGGSPSFQLRSASGRFVADAYNIERIQFTGGGGNDRIETADRGGSIAGGGGIDHWIADLSRVLTDITFIVGGSTAIAAAGLTAISGIERVTLTTGAGADSLLGGTEADVLNGSAGNDTINARTRPTEPGSAIDVVDGGAGTDRLVVNATGETGAVQLFLGSAPSFQLRSETGRFVADAYSIEQVSFTGGNGGDRIETGSRAVAVDGGGGIDHWIADLSASAANIVFNLATTTSIAAAGISLVVRLEQVTLKTGAGNDRLTGGAQADDLSSGNGNDVIDLRSRPTASGSGIDRADGGGIDTLVVDASAESQSVQVFAGGSPSFQLRSASGNFVADAFAMEVLDFTGGRGADQVTGKDRGDVLRGGDGDDTLNGGGGADSIFGGGSNDRISGGRGADQITLGIGRDTLVYALVTESRAAPGAADVVTDFASGLDRIDLSAIDADDLATTGNQAFVLTSGGGSGAFTGVRGQLRSVAGLIEGDVTGDGNADFRITLSNGGIAIFSDLTL